MVGATGFEPATPCSQSRCATKLRYAPKRKNYEKRLYQILVCSCQLLKRLKDCLGPMPGFPVSNTVRIAEVLFFLFLWAAPAGADEFLDGEHSHYRQQILRIQEALEKGQKEVDQKSLLSDARRSARWIFAEPEAARTEKLRMNRRIRKEFFDLNLPVMVHTLPARPFLLQKTTSFSSLVTNFESGTIIAKVTVPYFEDKGLRKARNEAVFLSILLVKEGILSLPVLEGTPLTHTIPPKADQSGGTIETYIADKGITAEGLSLETHNLAAGGGIAVATLSIPIPLHIGNRLHLEMMRQEFSASTDTHCGPSRRKLPPTGLILDLRGKKIRPFRDPILVSETHILLLIPDVGRPSESIPHGWAGWTDGLDPTPIRKRVGTHPLVVRPEGFRHSQVFVLSAGDGLTVCRDLFPSKLLSSGHVMILVDPQQPVLTGRSSKGSRS